MFSILLSSLLTWIINIFNFIINIIFSAAYILNADAPTPWEFTFQDGASPGYEGIVALHDTVMFYLILILVSVFWVMFSLIRYFSSSRTGIIYKYLNHGTMLELIWTISPAFVLIAIAFPSFKLLYTLDEVIDPALTVKVTAHQWYWSYELSDLLNESGESIEFDSYMVPESDLELGQLRLLDVDNKLLVPVNTHIRFIVSSTDVLHDFAVPSLGLKIDATPGRLNQTSALIEREGVFYGQCSEICGVWHGFMPVVIEAVDVSDFFAWVDSN